MKVLVVYAHPNPLSFNHALFGSVREGLEEAGHEVRVRDLYKLNLKTNLDADDFVQILRGSIPDDIQGEQREISWAEGLVFVYPIWWIGPPSILKGWIDRVFLQGFAFDITDEGPKGLLKHKKALVITTTGGPEEGYVQTNTTELLSKPMTYGTLLFSGISDVAHKNFYAVPYVSDEERKGMLAEVKGMAKGF